MNCEYYFSSETEYRDSFLLDEIANKSVKALAYKLHFFVLTKSSIKFVLGKDVEVSNSTTSFDEFQNAVDNNNTGFRYEIGKFIRILLN